MSVELRELQSALQREREAHRATQREVTMGTNRNHGYGEGDESMDTPRGGVKRPGNLMDGYDPGEGIGQAEFVMNVDGDDA